MKKILLGFVFIILIVLCSCSKKNHLQNVQENLLLQTDSAFSKYSEQFGIANAYEKYIDDDAISFPQNRMPVKGKLSILNSFKKSNEYNLIWFPAFAEVSRTGDLGYTYGRYKGTYKNEKDSIIMFEGNYVNIWKKQIDGKWKVAIDIGN